MPKIIDLTGKKFNMLLVLENLGPRKRIKNSLKTDVWYKVQCDCGNTKEAIGYTVSRGFIKSCGCVNRTISMKSLEAAWKAWTLPGDTASFREAYRSYKTKCAADRGKIFDITEEQFRVLTSKNCHYCPSPPSNGIERRHKKVYFYNGLDRIDNSKGYTLDNVVPCCHVCNWMKLALTYEDFLSHIKAIYEKLNLQNH